jgi:hypothetical protein
MAYAVLKTDALLHESHKRSAGECSLLAPLVAAFPGLQRAGVGFPGGAYRQYPQSPPIFSKIAFSHL